MSFEERKQVIKQTFDWTVVSAKAVQDAGGSISVLDKIPEDLLTTLVCNGLVLDFRRKLDLG